jgi:hypothetical protein
MLSRTQHRTRSAILAAAALLALAGTALAQTAAPATFRVVSGQLQITSDNRQQQIELVVGPAAGAVQVVGVNDTSSRQFQNITSIALTTGTNLDVIAFQILTPVVPPIVVRTGQGESDVKFIYDLPAAPVATTRVAVVGGPANDKVSFEALSQTATFNAAWDVRLGEGDNESLAKVEHNVTAAATNVNFTSTTGSGLDKLELDVISAASAQTIRLAGNTGAGNDQAIVKFDGQTAAATALATNLDLGPGQDTGELLAVSRGGRINTNARLVGAAGDDNIKLLIEGDGAATVTMTGDAGNDLLDLEFKGDLAGGATQLGGLGDDLLKLIVIGPRRFSPLMDGGPGIDEAIGFGRIINVENIDRQ